MTRGGQRDGAGRKELPKEERAKMVSGRLFPEELAKFRRLGGFRWLKKKLSEEP